MMKYGINYIMIVDCGTRSIAKLYAKVGQPTDIKTNDLIKQLGSAREAYDWQLENDFLTTKDLKAARKRWKLACKSLKAHLKTLKQTVTNA